MILSVSYQFYLFIRYLIERHSCGVKNKARARLIG
jgi:hypothetical protein